jgi:hypothetical protein
MVSYLIDGRITALARDWLLTNSTSGFEHLPHNRVAIFEDPTYVAINLVTMTCIDHALPFIPHTVGRVVACNVRPFGDAFKPSAL